MIKQLQKTLKIIEKINHSFNNKIITKKRLKEEHENMQDLLELQEKFNQKIAVLKNTPLSEDEQINSALLDTSRDLMSLEWHVGELQELLELIIGKYRITVDKSMRE